MHKLVIASHNQGKVAEIDRLLQPFGFEVLSATDAHISEPEETGLTFAENAALKSEHGVESCGIACLADDSGLVVPALDGDPGIYSARWGGLQKDFKLAMQKVQDALVARGVDPNGQNAHFICMLALSIPGEKTVLFEGKVEGTLTFPPRGEKGFGYDPIFIPHGYDVSFAELLADEKQRISHRADAFRQLQTYLQDNVGLATTRL